LNRLGIWSIKWTRSWNN